MTPSRTRRRIARVLNVLIVAGLMLAFAPPPGAVQAAQKTTLFDDALGDYFNWFWTDQREIQTPSDICPPSPAPCLSLPARFPNPDGVDTLPIASTYDAQESKAEEQKISGIFFDITARGVVPGSTIKKLTISLLEEGGRNQAGKSIKACLMADQFSGGEAELWANRPPVDESKCVQGTQITIGTPPAPYWIFDITNIAKGWGVDPFSNYGVMLKPVIPAGVGPTDGTWQINLKVPRRDDPDTELNEYEDTKTRARMTYDFTLPPPPPPPPPIDNGSGSGSGGFVPPPPPPEVPTLEPVPSTQPTVPSSEPVADKVPEPKVPGQVWLLLPVGILVLSMTRSAVLEPESAGDGARVIEAIRRRNAQRRGAPFDEEEAPAFASRLSKKIFGRFAR
jgi:hypothetical protein